MGDVRSYRLMMGLLAAAWVGVGVAILVGMIQAGIAGTPMGIATIVGIVLGALGAIGTLMFRKWGLAIYLTASLLLFVKPWLFADGQGPGGGWSYGLLLLFYLALVAANWGRFKRGDI